MEKILETRTFSQVKEIRLNEDNNTAVVQGYATTFNSQYPIYGGPENGGWIEQIARGATKKSISEKADVRFLINHEGLALSRTSSGSLNLIEDEIGLYSEARLNLNRPDAQNAFYALKDEDVNQMSFAFRVIRDEWTEGRTLRTIKEVELVDVSLVTYPANPATQMKLRNQILEQVEARFASPSIEEIRSRIASVL